MMRSISSAVRSWNGAIKPSSVSTSAKFSPRSLDGLRLHVGLVDHAVVPLGDGRARIEAAQRAEGVGRIAVGAKLVRVVEAARLRGRRARRASAPSSIESFCDPGSSGRS